MNNKLKTAFPNSFGADASSLDYLTWAVSTGEDPLEVCRRDVNIELFDMHRILKCRETDYDAHYHGYGTNGMDDGRAKQALSPLNGTHVLNFCNHIKIHPADMVSLAGSPTESIPHHMYQALHMIASSSTATDYDREKALSAIQVEKSRYSRYTELVPMAGQYFAELSEYASEFKAKAACKVHAVSEFKGMQDQDLARILIKAFNRRDKGRIPSNPGAHFGDLHMLRIGEVEEKIAEVLLLDVGVKSARLRALQILRSVSDNAETLLVASVDAVRSMQNAGTERIVEKLVTMLSDNIPDAEPGQIKVIAQSVHLYAVKNSDLERASAALDNQRTELARYENWLDDLQRSDMFYVQNLYANHLFPERQLQPSAAVILHGLEQR